jgi:hypothetical protein
MNDRSRTISRRSASAILAGAIAWPCSGASAQQVPNQATTVAHDLLIAIFEDPKSACEIGTACLKLMADEANTPDHLVNTIVGTPGCDYEMLRDGRTLKQHISNRVHHDFTEGAVVNAEGWVLSITEARLYALAALVAGPALKTKRLSGP